MSKMPRLGRYAGLRAAEPLSVLADGRLLYRFKRRWCDETTRVIFEPIGFIKNLATLAPAPRFNCLLISPHMFYEEIPLKLALKNVSQEQEDKRLLAHEIGKHLDERDWAYPTLGSICMEDAFKFMRDRFEELEGEYQDCLRAIQLLGTAGILPFKHSRIQAVLSDVFGRHPSSIRDCLSELCKQAFIKPPADQDPVESEPSYLFLRLNNPVVYYSRDGSLDPHHGFSTLIECLEKLRDADGLFYLGVTYGRDLEQPNDAFRCFNLVLNIKPDFGMALLNKGIALGQLNRSEEAISAYDEFIIRFKDAAEPALREQIAEALFNKGIALGQLNRSEEAISAYDEFIIRFKDAAEPALRAQVANALFNKGVTLRQLNRGEEAISAFNEFINHFKNVAEPALCQQVAQYMIELAQRTKL